MPRQARVSIWIQIKETGARIIGRTRQSFRGLKTAIAGATGAVLGFTAGLAGVGFATLRATQTSTRFEASLTKIVALVGVARDQVTQWRREILALAPAVGRGPNELAEALFVVTSAGERGAAALEIVEAAAKASAIGLGETKEVARAVTAAMQAYARAGLTAEQATDTLVATVREGNLEASELAGSLGRVLGIAAEAGVSFNELGTFVATFTRVGVNAEEAVTALRGILATVIKPAKGAQTALAKFGLSASDLRMQIRERGLTATLIDLVQTLSSDEEALAKVIPNVRALAGVLATASSQSEAFQQISDSLANSQGALATAFEETRKDAMFAFDSMKASIEGAAIAIGDELAPGAIKFADIIKTNTPLIVAIFRVTLQSIKTFLSAFFNAGKVLGSSFETGISLIAGAIVELIDKVIVPRLNKLLDGIDFLAEKVGLGFDFRIATIGSQEFFDNAEDSANRTRQAVVDFDTSLGKLGESWHDLFTQIRRQRLGPNVQVALGARGGGGAGTGGGGGGGEGGQELETAADAAKRLTRESQLLTAQFEAGLISFDEFKERLDELAPAMLLLRDSGMLTAEELTAFIGVIEQLKDVSIEAAGPVGAIITPPAETLSFWEAVRQSILGGTTEAERFNQVMADITTNTIRAFGDAIATSFQALVEGSQSAAATFAQSMLGAIAAVARGFGEMFLGLATAALAQSFLPPPLGSPSGVAAAAKFGAAAAAMFALSGALSGVAGGGGGGAAGAAAATNQGAAVEGGGEGPAVLIIQGGLLDTSDPRQADALERALEDLSGRKVIIQGG